jgi:hypothetical protein
LIVREVEIVFRSSHFCISNIYAVHVGESTRIASAMCCIVVSDSDIYKYKIHTDGTRCQSI